MSSLWGLTKIVVEGDKAKKGLDITSPEFLKEEINVSLERNMTVCFIIFLARQITLARPTTKKESISIWKNMNRKYMDK